MAAANDRPVQLKGISEAFLVDGGEPRTLSDLDFRIASRRRTG